MLYCLYNRVEFCLTTRAFPTVLSNILRKETFAEIIDWDSFIIHSERGTYVEKFVKELQEDD